MAWETPKIDWFGYSNEDGTYMGDRFNAADFNRLKNNLAYLRDIAVKLYEDFDIADVGADKSPADYFYADEINTIEENLNTINNNTLKRKYGDTQTYVPNGSTIDYNELNRLESAMLDIYNRLMNELSGLRMFEWCFGMKGGDL